MPKPSACVMAVRSKRSSFSRDEYSGNINALKHVCAVGRRSLSLPLRSEARRLHGKAKSYPLTGHTKYCLPKNNNSNIIYLLHNDEFQLDQSSGGHALGSRAERKQLLLFLVCESERHRATTNAPVMFPTMLQNLERVSIFFFSFSCAESFSPHQYKSEARPLTTG
jgi:hypothetical protein